MIQEESNRRLATCRRRQRELARRVLRVAGMVDAAAKLGCVLNSAEIERWKRVDHVASACAHGDFAERLTEVAEVADGSGAGVELHMRDGRKIEALRALLKEQLRGIAHLGDVCDTARRDVALMTDGLAKHHR